jgi:pimeloyl-ACP methyl ester carboxylesterase
MPRAVVDQRERADGRNGTSAAPGGPAPAARFERRRRELFARHGFEAEGRWIDDPEGRPTYVLERGESDHPTVLVHGGLSHAGEWAPLAGRMPGRVVIPDRPGCGLTHPIDYRRVNFRESAASWLLDVLNAIGADEADLVGNSMGGFFSIAFALAHPDRVRRIVFVGAPAGIHRSVPWFLRLWGNPVSGALIRRLKITDPEELRERVYGSILVAHPEDVPVELLEMDIANAELPGVEQSAYALLRAGTTLRGIRKRLLLSDELAGLDVPSLFLWGASDAFAPPSIGADVAARMPDATIEVLPDTGHLPHVERPETVAAAVARFLSATA